MHILYRLATRDYFCCIVPAKVRTCSPATSRDGVAICRNLLAHVSLSVFVWGIGILAFIGNLCVLIQYFTDSHKTTKVPYLLVANLALSDFLLSVYLLIIAVAGTVFYGTYNRSLTSWLKSWPCYFACLIGASASLMSVLMMLLISIDRYICIVYPFSNRKLTAAKARIIAGCFWVLSLSFVAVPVITSIGQDGNRRLYHYTSVCMPSNIIDKDYRAWIIAFTVITMLAWLITFSLYIVMFISIRQSAKNLRKSSSRKDKTIAIRLFLILISDLASWLPFYYTIYRKIAQNSSNVFEYPFVIIVALPLNAAINPYIYTFTDSRLVKTVLRCCHINPLAFITNSLSIFRSASGRYHFPFSSVKKRSDQNSARNQKETTDACLNTNLSTNPQHSLGEMANIGKYSIMVINDYFEEVDTNTCDQDAES